MFGKQGNPVRVRTANFELPTISGVENRRDRSGVTLLESLIWLQ